MIAIRRFLDEIKVEHTLFALPFAYAGALLAARGMPTLHQVVWITIAVLGARTAAMAANRLFDARFDARNPRTARRALPAGTLSPSVMIAAAVVGIALLAVAALQLNPLCLAMLPIGALALVVYPFVKRWSWGVHFFLGAVDALAPLGAWIAVTGRFELGAWLLFAAVTIWVAGFDILYALMDHDFDVAEGLHSIPSRFGAGAGRGAPQYLHWLLVMVLAVLGAAMHAPPAYYAGVAAAAVLAVYEGTLIRKQPDVYALNAAVFNANMAFSIVFLVAVAASMAVRA
jgi:4-hydroxybenzoate polyprenyltransferase